MQFVLFYFKSKSTKMKTVEKTTHTCTIQTIRFQTIGLVFNKSVYFMFPLQFIWFKNVLIYNL